MPSPYTSPKVALPALLAHLQTARLARHRTLVWISGEAASVQDAVRPLAEVPGALWLGEGQAAMVPATRVRQVLGREYPLVIVDAWSGLHPDALAAVAGTVRAGGALFLLSPPPGVWPAFADPDYARLASYPHEAGALPRRFLQRFCQQLHSEAVWHVPVEPGLSLAPLLAHDWPVAAAPAGESAPLAAQQTVLDALLAGSSTAVLLSRRGRGKSALLGFAAAHWHRQGLRVLVTAPSRAAVASLFRHAGQANPPVFMAPDAILANPQLEADVLLVDEAAALGLPVLADLLPRFPRMVMATTTEGYEGTGQGFILRFLRLLDAQAPGWQRYELSGPVRWSPGDPLESWLDEALLLSGDGEPVAGDSPGMPVFEACPQQDLLAQPRLLIQVFGLLRSAHYRTSPDDLRFLLDAPDLTLYLLRHGELLLAAALVVHEGGIDEMMVREIVAGRRRPRGHMLVQTLAVQEGMPDYLQRRVARIVRIAVQPSKQHQGWGSHLLQHICEAEQAAGTEWLGSSFSATPEVLSFWQQNGFRLVRLGHRRQAASAAPSAVVLRPLIPEAQNPLRS